VQRDALGGEEHDREREEPQFRHPGSLEKP
jgi:hypothetical protein